MKSGLIVALPGKGSLLANANDNLPPLELDIHTAFYNVFRHHFFDDLLLKLKALPVKILCMLPHGREGGRVCPD